MQHLKRRQDTAAGRQDAVRLVTAQGDGVPEAARNCGMHTKRLGRGTRQVARQPHGVSRGHGALSAAPDARLRWRTAVPRLRLEREMWQPAALFFAHASRGAPPA